MRRIALILTCAFGLGGPALAARAETDAPCRLSAMSGRVKIAECSRAGKVLVRLTVHRDQGPLEVYALFPHGGSGLFEHFWTAAARPQKLRAGEQAEIRELAKRLRAPGPARALARFLGAFAGPDFVLREYRLRPRAHPLLAEYKMICNRVGRYQTAEFTAFGKDLKARALVGSGPCLGRCGAGCGEERPGEGVYTQQCLNHDVCSYVTHANMGECEDEFWEAADGYLHAPDCASLRSSR